MSRADAVAMAAEYFTRGRFKEDLARRVSIPTESQNPERITELRRYLTDEIAPSLQQLDFRCELLDGADARQLFLLAERHEPGAKLTVLSYAHGDVIRGFAEQWREGTGPWILSERDGCHWGRGVADNKGQHTINIAALAAVMRARGKLGFNLKWIFEMGEEVGSPGLKAFCCELKSRLGADVFIASDGPRLKVERPTIFLGSRGCMSFDLSVKARERSYHSGNWGGVIANPAVQLAHGIAAIVGAKGSIKVAELKPRAIQEPIRRTLRDCQIGGGPGEPYVDPTWGEPGLTPAERLFAWSAVDVLAMVAGSPDTPVNAIPPSAWARLQVRFVLGVGPDGFVAAIQRHLEDSGLPMVRVSASQDEMMPATRLDPQNHWVAKAAKSIMKTTGIKPAVLPNFGGSLPNEVFAGLLALPTIWIPHSYPGCAQHAPNENLPRGLALQALQLMAGFYWDLGDTDAPSPSAGTTTSQKEGLPT